MFPVLWSAMVRAALVRPAMFGAPIFASALASVVAAPAIAVRPIAVRLERPPALRLSPSILLSVSIERWPASLRFRRSWRRLRLRVEVATLALFEPCALLIARELVSRARILVRAARPPVGVAARRLTPALDERKARGFRRFPQLAAIEPAQ